MRRRWLALAVIVTALSGCDNVAWGGVDMRLQAPPSRAEMSPSPAAADTAGLDEAASLPDLPTGPLLLAGGRNGSSATLVVVGEIRDGGIAPLASEEEAPGYLEYFGRRLLAPGSEFILFSGGVRVGRLTAVETGVDDRFCLPRPTVTGTVELVPDAVGARRLMAVPAAAAQERPFRAYRGVTDDYDERIASLNLASSAIATVSAPWPPSLLESRADIQAFPLEEDQDPAIAATFLYQDQLSVGPPGDRAYALFVLGTPEAGGYDRAYTWYRRADTEGKGAPRYFGHMDWDGDGESEILLDVLGAESRWFAGLARGTDGSWTRTFQDSCGSGSPSPGS